MSRRRPAWPPEARDVLAALFRAVGDEPTGRVLHELTTGPLAGASPSTLSTLRQLGLLRLMGMGPRHAERVRLGFLPGHLSGRSHQGRT